MRVLGIDPGTTRVGYGLIEIKGGGILVPYYGALMLSSNLNQEERIAEVYAATKGICKAFKPSIASVEGLFFSKNITSAMSVAEARGCILLALYHSKTPSVRYEPGTVKKAVTGNGRADKKSIQSAVANFLCKDDFKLDDISDAISLALTHIVVSGEANIDYLYNA